MNSLPARMTGDTTLLPALSLDYRLFIFRGPMGEHGYNYVYSGAFVLHVDVLMVACLFKCH